MSEVRLQVNFLEFRSGIVLSGRCLLDAALSLGRLNA